MMLKLLRPLAQPKPPQGCRKPQPPALHAALPHSRARHYLPAHGGKVAFSSLFGFPLVSPHQPSLPSSVILQPGLRSQEIRLPV